MVKGSEAIADSRMRMIFILITSILNTNINNPG